MCSSTSTTSQSEQQPTLTPGSSRSVPSSSPEPSSSILFDSPPSNQDLLSNDDDGASSTTSGPSGDSLSAKPKKKKKKSKDPGRPPRPPNAWILYRSDKIQSLQLEVSRQPQSEMSKLLGAMWQKESPEVKRGYAQQAELRKMEHQEKYPEYRFAPLRRSRPSSPHGESGPADAVTIERPTIGRSTSSPVVGLLHHRQRSATTSTSSPLRHESRPAPQYHPSVESSSSLGLLLASHQDRSASQDGVSQEQQTYAFPQGHEALLQGSYTASYPGPTSAGQYAHYEASRERMMDTSQAWEEYNAAAPVWHEPPQPSPVGFFTPMSAPPTTTYFSFGTPLDSYEFPHPADSPAASASGSLMEEPSSISAEFPHLPFSMSPPYSSTPLDPAPPHWHSVPSPEPSDFLMPDTPRQQECQAWTSDSSGTPDLSNVNFSYEGSEITYHSSQQNESC